jgi:putative tricarboxylic transport membrane protein
MRQSPFDVFLLYVVGLGGFLMRRYGFPAAPVIVGMILGPLAEEQMRRSLSISEGSWTIFLTHGISAVLLGLTVVVLLAPFIAKQLKKKTAAG